jgi:hypothetical protein
MIINFITSVLVAVQLIIGQVSVHLIEARALPNHRIWVEIPEPCFSTIYDSDTTDYEDYWTKNRETYLVELSSGTTVLVLAESKNEVLYKVNTRISEGKEAPSTVIAKILKDDFVVYSNETIEYIHRWGDMGFYIVHLSTGTVIEVLAASIDDAWDKVETKFLEKKQFKTTILSITAKYI